MDSKKFILTDKLFLLFNESLLMDTHDKKTVQADDLTESEAKELEALFDKRDTDKNINPKSWEKQKDSKEDSQKKSDESKKQNNPDKSWEDQD